MKNIAVILAGGSGRRLGASMPKQFLEIAGRTVLGHTLSRFNSSEIIDELCVVVHRDHVEDAKRIIADAKLSKPCILLTGGKERYDSSLAAVNYYVSMYENATEVNLLFHDAVRPLVTVDIINEVCKTLGTSDAVCVAVPSTDTILQADAEGNIVEIPDRSRLWNAQTPQGFKLGVIADAYRIAMDDPNFTATDDCGVVLKYRPDVRIKIVNGSQENIKLTFAADIERLAILLK